MRGRAALAVGPAEMLIPEGWEWLPLLAVARLESGHTPSRKHQEYWDGGIPWIGIRDAKTHNYRWIDSTEQTVSKKGLENSSARLLPAGTVCLSRTASVGYVTVMKRPMATSQDFVNWVCGDRIDPEYLMQLLRCEVPVLKRFSKGAVHQTIYFPEVKAFHIALPSLTEQKRIVTKVDELMTQLDSLEAAHTRKRDVQGRLRSTAFEALASAEEYEQFAVAWTRIADNFEILLSHADDARALRRTIVNMAVRGHLTQRSASAEPGPLLLQRLKERPKAVPNNSRRRGAQPADYPPIESSNTPYAPPAGWCWARFTDVASIDSNLVSPSKFGDLPHVAPDNIEKGTGRLLPYRTIREDQVTSGKHHFFPGHILYSKIRPNLSKVVIVDFEGLCSADMYPLTAKIDTRFLHLFMLSRIFLDQVVQDDNRLAMPKVNQEQLSATVVIVPPLDEQKRIVAKVDELMALCDKLIVALERSTSTVSSLAQAVVAEMVG
jgi:type I restriction enzyme S subunit